MDPRVPTPEKTLGFKIGDRFVTHGDVSSYVRAVAAAAPDRVRVETYGKTTEGRDLLLVVVTAPENLARFDELAGKVRSLYLPSSTKATTVPADLPVFVWFSYGVHGDEAASPDAAMATLYHLAASRNQETVELLRRVVLTMDPMANPDGRMRYLSWLATAVTGEPDANPDAREHHPAWPRGRTNHFGFDLNRDWAWVTQPETQARIARYARTPPQVHVDFHEMGPESSYFFPPSAEPLHAGLHRDSVKWLGVFGRENASAFDARGWTYFVREKYDLFYPAYGDSWSFFNGAIGMTYEMAGGPGAGLAYRRRDGSLLTLKERALKHFVSGLTTLATAGAHREELLRDFAAARAAHLASTDRYYVIPGDQDAYRLRLFLQTLSAQGIRVRQGAPAKKNDGGPLIVETAQPSGALAAALLDEKAELPAKFLESERTKFLRREEEGFYDVTAWSLPAAFGLRASRMAGRAPAGADAEPRPGRVGSGARLGYLVRSPGLAAFPILARCSERHVVASIAAKEFRLAGESYATGSLFLRREGAPSDLDSIVRELADSTGADFTGVASAWTEEGIALGSERFVTWKPARVALLTGPGVDRSSSGWAIDQFYRVFHYPVSVLDVDSFDEAELARYNALIVPTRLRPSRRLSPEETARRCAPGSRREGSSSESPGARPFSARRTSNCPALPNGNRRGRRNRRRKKKPPRRKSGRARRSRRRRTKPTSKTAGSGSPARSSGLARSPTTFFSSEAPSRRECCSRPTPRSPLRRIPSRPSYRSSAKSRLHPDMPGRRRSSGWREPLT